MCRARIGSCVWRIDDGFGPFIGFSFNESVVAHAHACIHLSISPDSPWRSTLSTRPLKHTSEPGPLGKEFLTPLTCAPSPRPSHPPTLIVHREMLLPELHHHPWQRAKRPECEQDPELRAQGARGGLGRSCHARSGPLAPIKRHERIHRPTNSPHERPGAWKCPPFRKLGRASNGLHRHLRWGLLPSVELDMVFLDTEDGH